MSNYIKRPVEYLYYRAGGGSFSTDLKNIFTDKDKEKGTRNLVDGLRLYWDLNFRPTDEFNDAALFYDSMLADIDESGVLWYSDNTKTKPCMHK